MLRSNENSISQERHSLIFFSQNSLTSPHTKRQECFWAGLTKIISFSSLSKNDVDKKVVFFTTSLGMPKNMEKFFSMFYDLRTFFDIEKIIKITLALHKYLQIQNIKKKDSTAQISIEKNVPKLAARLANNSTDLIP